MQRMYKSRQMGRLRVWSAARSWNLGYQPAFYVTENKTMNWINASRLFSAALVFLYAAGLGASQVADAPKLTFMTHAAFFSSETHQPKTLDPQVFVQDASAPGALGPQNIQHVAGVRPPFIDQDAKVSALFNAKGQPLRFDLGHWLGATGVVTIAPVANGKAEITADFSNLQPGGSYSLFENHFDLQPIGFTPLDGAGSAYNFIASQSGTAHIVVTAPQLPTYANAVLLVYHSDKAFHGDQRGEIGLRPIIN